VLTRAAIGLTAAQFVDLCILLGCDYVDPIPKVGPSTALKLIRDHGTLEKVVEWMRSSESKGRYTIPEDWPFADARDLFFRPDVRAADDPQCDFKWESPDVDGLVAFLVGEKGFSEDRVRGSVAKLQKNLKSSQQARLEGFFKVVPKTEEERMTAKRKSDDKATERRKKAKESAKEKASTKAKPKMNS
jgi:flap endonuclease-1